MVFVVVMFSGLLKVQFQWDIYLYGLLLMMVPILWGLMEIEGRMLSTAGAIGISTGVLYRPLL
jgi:hypothetical protein